MKKILADQLYINYPDLFDSFNYSITCGDGWFKLLNIVCYKIDWHNKHQISAMTYFPEKFINNPYQAVKILQIQEKLGGLKIYVSGGDYYILGVIDLAEEMGRFFCEVCGDNGYINYKNDKVSILCSIHQE